MCKGDVGRMNIGGRRRRRSWRWPRADLAEVLVAGRSAALVLAEPGAPGAAAGPGGAWRSWLLEAWRTWWCEARRCCDLLSRQSFSAAMAGTTP